MNSNEKGTTLDKIDSLCDYVNNLELIKHGFALDANGEECVINDEKVVDRSFIAQVAMAADNGAHLDCFYTFATTLLRLWSTHPDTSEQDLLDFLARARYSAEHAVLVHKLAKRRLKETQRDKSKSLEELRAELGAEPVSEPAQEELDELEKLWGE